MSVDSFPSSQEERKKMLLQQCHITRMEERTRALRRKIHYAQEHSDISDSEVSEYTHGYG